MDSKIPAFGFLYSEYADQLPLNARFKVYINNLETMAEVLQWYIDLNDGGVAHTEDEINFVKNLLKKKLTKSLNKLIFSIGE